MEDRFWTLWSVEKEQQVFGPATCGVVDEEHGGVIAYFPDEMSADNYVRMLEEKHGLVKATELVTWCTDDDEAIS